MHKSIPRFFFYPANGSEQLKETYDTIFKKSFLFSISRKFCECIEQKVASWMEAKTGFTAGDRFSLDVSSSDGYNKLYVGENNSYFYVGVHVNHNWTWIQLHWRSHSGKTIHPSSEDFDCSDIDFWLEPLDIELWYKQMYPPLKNPFLTKNLNYTLTVKSLQVDITATIHCTITSVDELTILANQLSDILGQLNDASEKNNRKSGVFHNWSYEVTNTSTVTFFIDMGSAGVKQVNKWLQKINAFSAISTVIIS